MHSFPVFLALAVLNVAQTSPLPQVEPNFVATSVTQHTGKVKLPANSRPFKRRALVRVCVVDGHFIPQPTGGHCDGETRYMQSDDPILHANTKSLIGNPLDTSADGSVDKEHPGVGVKVKATVLGLHLGQDDPAVASPDGSAPAPTSTDGGNGDGDLLGGIGGIKFLGLGGPRNADSNSGSSSNSDSNSGSRNGQDGRNRDTASISTTLLGANHRGSGSQSSGSPNGGDDGDGDGSFIPGVPIFAGHYGPGGRQRQNPSGNDHNGPNVGDHGKNGPGEGDHGSAKGDHSQNSPDGNDHGRHGLGGDDHGDDGSDAGQDGYEGSGGDDHWNDGYEGDSGYEGGDGYEGSDGYEGGSHGENGEDHPHGDDGPDGGDHESVGSHSGLGSDEDCDEKSDGNGKKSPGGFSHSGLDHTSHSKGHPEHSPNSHAKPHSWSPDSSSSPPKHHQAADDPKDKLPHRHDTPSNSQTSPSPPSFKWEDSKPQCGCDK